MHSCLEKYEYRVLAELWSPWDTECAFAELMLLTFRRIAFCRETFCFLAIACCLQ